MNTTFTHDRLDLLETFVRIVEAGSLSAAARQLGTTQPTVSRRLQALEAALQVRLVQRSTHALRLTEDGQRCYRQPSNCSAIGRPSPPPCTAPMPSPRDGCGW